MSKAIRVGLIGVNADRGWAMRSHMPALRASSGFEVTALSTRHADTAAAAARAFDVPLAFDDYRSLVRHPDVDLVVVTVRVPSHYELVVSAIEAGKHVYCEWPLAVDGAQGQKLLDLAQAKGIRHFIGLQSRASPVVERIKRLVKDGYIGSLLSTSVVGSGEAWGASTDTNRSYLFDARNGATMLSIPVGHFLDAFCYCLGEFDALSATLVTRRQTVKIVDTGMMVSPTSPDQIAIQGVLACGAVASIHYRGGRCQGENFRWELNGTDGDIVVSAPSGHLQYEALRLQGASGKGGTLADLEPAPAQNIWGNVAGMYTMIAKDIREGTSEAPTFETAVALHARLSTIEAAAQTGMRQRI